MPTKEKMSEVKLTKAQKTVIENMRAGTVYYFNAVTRFRPHTVGEYGMHAKMVHGSVMNNLESMGLIEKKHFIKTILYKYQLTPLGHTIPL